MTLSSRHRIRNSSPGGLRPSTLPLGHGGSPQYWLSHVDGEETFFVSFKPPRPGTEPRTLAWKAAVLTTNVGPPPFTIGGTLGSYGPSSQINPPGSGTIMVFSLSRIQRSIFTYFCAILDETWLKLILTVSSYRFLTKELPYSDTKWDLVLPFLSSKL